MNAHNHSLMGDVFQQADSSPFADLHFCNHPQSQLQAIIAIHSTELGPALGGTRCLAYPDTQSALTDALRLAKGMSYKSAINRLPFGGGKAVILYPQHSVNRHDLLSAYGDFVDSLGGRYITAVDSGTSPNDMDIIAQRTRHVVCTSRQMAGTGDPSPYTAQGVLRGIQAALKHLTGSDELNSRHIVIQGVGHVGFDLARRLKNRGARLTLSDTDKERLKACQQQLDCDIVTVDAVYDIACDVFSPCALGQVINPQTLQRLHTSIIAGSANNQLLEDALGEQCLEQGVLYAPDYVINSGGMLQIAYIHEPELIEAKIDQLYDTLLEIFTQSAEQHLSTNLIANQMAQAIMHEQRRKPILGTASVSSA